MQFAYIDSFHADQHGIIICCKNSVIQSMDKQEVRNLFEGVRVAKLSDCDGVTHEYAIKEMEPTYGCFASENPMGLAVCIGEQALPEKPIRFIELPDNKI